METLQNNPELNRLAKELKKRVVILLIVYGFVLVFSLILFLICEALGTGIIYYVVIKEGVISGYVIVAAACLIGGGFILLKTVLAPLFCMFFSESHYNKEIKRKNYPELFAFIDEVVKSVNCNPPKHVYLSNDNNAFVNCPSILGYLFHGAQDLTIGIPLLFGMNRSEFKSILSHEFGHFSQDAVSINMVANLSEFICSSIYVANKKLETEEGDKVKAFARFLTAIVNDIMMGEYEKLAPINGQLSRALEYDADKYSYKTVGTEASLSALNKLKEMSFRWDYCFKMLLRNGLEAGRAPENVYDLFCKCSAKMDRVADCELNSAKHFRPATGDFDSRIENIVNTDTHPSMNKRYRAISSYKYKMTKWDNLPALDFFPAKVIQERFNSVIFDLRKGMPHIPHRTIKKDVRDEEFLSKIPTVSPLLHYFFDEDIFYDIEILKNIDQNNYEVPFPFTEINANKIQEYICAKKDLFALQDIADEQKKTSFLYNGEKYTNENIPFAEHRIFYSKKYAAAREVAEQCNIWMIQRLRNDNTFYGIYKDMVSNRLSLKTIEDIWDEAVTAYNKKIPDGPAQVAEHLRSYFSDDFEKQEDGSTQFEWMCENLELDSDKILPVKALMSGEKITTFKDLLDTCKILHTVYEQHCQLNWKVLKGEVVMPAMLR